MKKKLLYSIACFTIASFVSAGLMAQTDPGSDNLTHWWKFDGDAQDAVGGAHGNAVGAEFTDDAGVVAKELDQIITLPAQAIGINSYSQASFAIWFESIADSNTSWHMAWYFGDSTGGVGHNGIFFSPARGDDVGRTAISTARETEPWGVERGVSDTTEYDDGMLRHAVTTIDSEFISFYIDGNLVGKDTLTSDPAASLSEVSNDNAWLFRGGYGGDPSWRGTIYDFRIYDRVLTDDEVAYLYGNFPTSVDAVSVANNFSLSQNYPNPFSGTTRIDYAVQEYSNVSLTVYNVMGQEVTTLVNEFQSPGEYSTLLNAEDLPSGIYYYQLQVNDQQETRKMILSK